MANQLSAVNHVVQLMLENRSFDQMLGFLYSDTGNQAPNNQSYEGLTGNETNPDDLGNEISVYKVDENAPHPYLMPGADPGEGFFNTNYQLFSTDDPAPGAVPNFTQPALQTRLSNTLSNLTVPDPSSTHSVGIYRNVRSRESRVSQRRDDYC